MKSFSLVTKSAIAAIALAASIQPAFADVKAGVDAWSRGDYAAAVKEWRDPALSGNPDAQFNMGQAYKLGRGVKTDLDVSADWYLKAARQNHLQASDSYGQLMHYRGRIAEALPYLQSSADRGEPRSQYLLATELFNGTNMGKDWVRAYALMTRASSSGLAPASRSLSQMDKYIPLDQRQKGVALAGELEKREGKARNEQLAGFPIDTKPQGKAAKPAYLPQPATPDYGSAASYSPPATPDYGYGSAGDEPGFPGDMPAMPGSKPAVKKAPPVKAATKPAKQTAKIAQAPASGGNWRIQLGAFGDERNARKLWTSLESQISALTTLTPYLKAAGEVTRLQAGPFASRGAADAMCTKVKANGQSCIPVQN